MGNKPKAKKTTDRKRKPVAARLEQPTAAKTPWLKYAAFGAGAVVVVVLLVMAFSGLAPIEAPGGIQDYPGLARDHTAEAVVYEQDPPVGGPHASSWMNCGFYNTEVPNGNAIHSLEHGAVWLTYDPGLSEDELDKLRDFGTQSKVLVSAYPGLGDDVVAAVWGRQLRIPEFDESVIKAFIVTQKDGATTPEPGALCSGGVGNPTG
ncbi:MAG: DUF3105 domain-containing protein [Acidimicrobiia bacterium]|nr:DUF3105 domain-containing protein [Acidimicrobiia bacterium]